MLRASASRDQGDTTARPIDVVRRVAPGSRLCSLSLARPGHEIMDSDHNEPPLIAGPVPNPSRPALLPPPGAWDTHAHVFGPAENYIALLDCLGLARGVIVQGNAHGYDNGVVLDALDRHGARVRGVAITDTRIAPATLRDWH